MSFGGYHSGKVGTGMCGPDGAHLRPLRFTKLVPFYLKIGLDHGLTILTYVNIVSPCLDIGRVFAKCLIFDEFFLWLTYRLSKSTYASQFTW